MKRDSPIVMLMVTLLFPVFVTAQKKSSSPKEKDMSAYLMVYFKDDDHSLHMALSKDGYSFTDVNGGRPVIGGDSIAEQKGIRDPYIYRAPDGTFYMALTDLHIYAQKVGYRDTPWERELKAYGWGNNRGLVLMKSKDLINWSHKVLRVDQEFPGFTEIGCAWAPEMIYDEQKQKTMIYFSMRFGDGKAKVYYSYMNKDFTAMETVPKPIFELPSGDTYIDSDITKIGKKYYMFYGSSKSIKMAVSDSINTGYRYDPRRIDPEKVSAEAPTIYKRIREDKWILVYDIYGLRPNNFGFSETSDFVNFRNLGRFNEGVMKSTNFSIPKHPNVIHLTRKEAQRLADNWHLDMKF